MNVATRYYRKIIHLCAEHSPNVRLARAQIKAGLPVTGEEIVPGVMTWERLQSARLTWDPVEQCIGLDGRFYEGKELRLYPGSWLALAIERFRQPKGVKGQRTARGIGCDPAEGGDDTAMCAVDEWGVIEILARKTPNTAVIQGDLLGFMRKHGVENEAARVCIDAGGGGKQLADNLRAMGKSVRTVRFGESITLDPKRAKRLYPERVEQKEDRYVYVNRRAEMYYELALLLDPDNVGHPVAGSHVCKGFCLPPPEAGPTEAELHRQLGLIPKVLTKGNVTWTMWDPEGRIRMLPKERDTATDGEKKPCLQDVLGCSPDETDALVLAVHAMLHRGFQSFAGSV